MHIDYLALILRLLHILAAITTVGGSIFIRYSLLPGMRVLSEPECQRFYDVMRPRWARLVQISILFLLVSGLWNFILFVRASKGWGEEWREAYYMPYQVLFGIKFLLALAIFALASILTGRSAATQKIRDNPRLWLNVVLAMAVAVVIISGLMRLTHVGPTDPRGQTAVEAQSGG